MAQVEKLETSVRSLLQSVTSRLPCEGPQVMELVLFTGAVYKIADQVSVYVPRPLSMAGNCLPALPLSFRERSLVRQGVPRVARDVTWPRVEYRVGSFWTVLFLTCGFSVVRVGGFLALFGLLCFLSARPPL